MENKKLGLVGIAETVREEAKKTTENQSTDIFD